MWARYPSWLTWEVPIIRKSLLSLLLLSLAACNLSVRGFETPSATATSREVRNPDTPTPTAVRTATQTFLPADLPFTIDCSALPDSRRSDCDAFLAATRDRVYPLEREWTGVNLSDCYAGLHYVILPTDPVPGAGGISAGDVITYNQRYSIDLAHRYDTHELLHSISTCARALDQHVFHGMIQNAVYARLSVYDPGYYEARDSENLTVNLEFLLGEAKTASGAELSGLCTGILARKMTIAYFDLGESAIRPLYRSTIEPLQNLTPPGAKMTEVWGGLAPRVDALLEKLRQAYSYDLGVPECGLTAA
jgi:hypothetical protein